MSLVPNITLACIDCSHANDDDRIILALTQGRLVIRLCGYAKARTRFCVDHGFTSPDTYASIRRLSGVAHDTADLHVGIETSSRIGGPPLIVPTIDDMTLPGFVMSEQIVDFTPATVQGLTPVRRGLTLAPHVA